MFLPEPFKEMKSLPDKPPKQHKTHKFYFSHTAICYFHRKVQETQLARFLSCFESTPSDFWFIQQQLILKMLFSREKLISFLPFSSCLSVNGLRASATFTESDFSSLFLSVSNQTHLEVFSDSTFSLLLYKARWPALDFACCILFSSLLTQ